MILFAAEWLPAATLLQTYSYRANYQMTRFSPDGSTFLLQAEQSTLIFDTHQHNFLFELPAPAQSSLVLYQNARTIVTAAPGSSVLDRYDVPSGQHLESINLPVTIMHIEFTDTDHALIYSQSPRQTVTYLQLTPLQVIWSRPVGDFRLSRNGDFFASLIATGSSAPTTDSQPVEIGVFRTSDGQPISTSAIYRQVHHYEFLPDNLHVMAIVDPLDSAAAQTLEIISIADGSQALSYHVQGLELTDQIVITTDSQTLIGLTAASKIITLDLQRGTTSTPTTVSGNYVHLALNPAGTLLLATQPDLVITLHFPGFQIDHSIYDSFELTGQIALSPDGQYVAANANQLFQSAHEYEYITLYKIAIFSAQNGRLLHAWPGRLAANSVFSHAKRNSPLLITSGTQTLLLNLFTGRPKSVLPCPQGTFSDDGNRVIVTTTTAPNLFEVYDTHSGRLLTTVDSGMITTHSTVSGHGGYNNDVSYTTKTASTVEFLLEPQGATLYCRANSLTECIRTYMGWTDIDISCPPTCLSIDLKTNQRTGRWNGPDNAYHRSWHVGQDGPRQLGLLTPSAISGDGTCLAFDKSVVETKSMNTVTTCPYYIMALDESGHVALVRSDFYSFGAYSREHGYLETISPGYDVNMDYPVLSSYQNRLLALSAGRGYLYDLKRTTETQIGGVHLHPLIDPDGTFAPGQVLRVVWNLNLQTAGTAAQLELVNVAHPAQSFVLAQAWAPFGAATTWVTLPDKLYSGSYILRARSVWNNALCVDSAPLTIAGDNGADNWTQYE